jgi:hypothetical protein
MNFDFYVINRDNGYFVARRFDDAKYAYYYTNYLKFALKFTTAKRAMEHMVRLRNKTWKSATNDGGS